MRTLVIGAGVAGLTLAARLAQAGAPPVIVERSVSVEAGYAIGLYPTGSGLFHEFGTYDELRRQSLVVDRYLLANEGGRVLQEFDMSVLTDSTGPMLMVARNDLLCLLERSCGAGELRRGLTVRAVVPNRDKVDVTFSDGNVERFDVVVACDGINSRTRNLVFGPARGFNSGWMLWTWWAGSERFAPDVVREWWGSGTFFGVYPAAGRLMCAAGGPARSMHGDEPQALLRRQLAKLIEAVPAVGGAIDDLSVPYSWPMRDVRAQRWIEGRVALCGDAAVGFLPTAGAGASEAIRAATVLAEELARADASSVVQALTAYERRCRKAVERNQNDSRRLARAMFVRRPALVWVRDQLARRYPAKRATCTSRRQYAPATLTLKNDFALRTQLGGSRWTCARHGSRSRLELRARSNVRWTW